MLAEEILDLRVHLDASNSTVVHIVKYRNAAVRPRLKVFAQNTGLLTWCRAHGVSDAINGGFTLHHTETLLGEHRIDGEVIEHLPFTAPWDTIRGTAHMSDSGGLDLAPRNTLPDSLTGDVLQAGPLLVSGGKSLIIPDDDPEGIAASSDQFDDDWTVERFPRAGIGVSNEYIWTVATDGYVRPRYVSSNAGLRLSELADVFLKLGAQAALNLDGGSSATQVADSRIINKPSAGVRDDYAALPLGHPVPSAIIFEPRR